MPEAKVVYLVRHGQSVDNAARVFQSPDSPLSGIGQEQAKKLAQRLSGLTFDALISSPFERAKGTTAFITDRIGLVTEYSELFVERLKPRGISGRPYADKEIHGLWRSWEESLYTPGTRVEDGENYDDLLERADKALAYLKNRPEESMLVVTHGDFLRTVLARVLLGELFSGEALRNIQKVALIDNSGITALRFQKAYDEVARWRLWIYNDHSHLADPT